MTTGPFSPSVGVNEGVIAQVISGDIHIEYDGRHRPLPLRSPTDALPPEPRRRTPTVLLQARRAVVPLVGRNRLLGEFQEWCTSESLIDVLLIGGQGGSGKTRLAVELCRRVGDTWVSGFLHDDFEPVQFEVLEALGTNRLVVVDYAETRPAQVADVVRRLEAAASDGARVRVLLLARRRPVRGGWWSLFPELVEDGWDEAAGLVELDDEQLNPRECRGLFDAGVQALCAARGVPIPPDAAPGRVTDFDGEEWDNALAVLMRASLAAAGEGSGLSGLRLLDALVEHESRYWAGLDGSDELKRRVVATATLFGAESEDEATDLLRLVPGLADATGERRRELALACHRLYHQAGGAWLGGIEPDRVGEHLVATALVDRPEVLTAALGTDRPTISLRRALVLLSRATVDHPGDFVEVMAQVGDAQFVQLVDRAVDEASGTIDVDRLFGGETLAATLGDAIMQLPLTPNVLTAASDRLPPANLVISELGLRCSLRLSEIVRKLAASDEDTYAPFLAAVLNNLASFQSAVGRREEALATAEEAVAIRRRLADANPAAYLADLAGSV
ncbi:MAG: tetratricopeptide repeat protein, partial [Actinomycetota bacterium]|nr:tetratricopeptide repeat protein [Actinomycetota bacterium]